MDQTVLDFKRHLTPSKNTGARLTQIFAKNILGSTHDDETIN